MGITSIRLENFTAFSQLELIASPGINVLIGENATGKTHLLKVAYAACDVTTSGLSFADKLVRVFLPHHRQLGRLVHRQRGSSRAQAEVHRGKGRLAVSFSNHAADATQAQTTGSEVWSRRKLQSAYIPVKEMLAQAPGFRSLYTSREVHFEEVYADILDRAYLPVLRDPMDDTRKHLLSVIEKAIEGKVVVQQEEFFLRSKQGNLEFTLLAEGLRKLALLWLLIQNGTVQNGAVLFWDEPETNLNPGVIGEVVEILVALQRLGVQVFFATHNYVVLKELDLRRAASDEIRYHALSREADTGKVSLKSSEELLAVEPNPIAAAFLDLYDRDVERALAVGREQ